MSFSANCENVSTTTIRTSKGDGKKHLDHRWMSRCQIFLQRHPAVSLRDQAWHVNPSEIDDFVPRQ
ncbi:hypothetical protein C4D60_Mb08t12060 [Musa balbisiana]|uniref:Uncharacterized protein n=1 Tax=Musa balbisiana TaxID=52838 RepID=A0A4S8K360_MUSBA|nr:hypothetical protein C4D60_Mb08t12060 [Musa balbisiana]